MAFQNLSPPVVISLWWKLLWSKEQIRFWLKNSWKRMMNPSMTQVLQVSRGNHESVFLTMVKSLISKGVHPQSTQSAFTHLPRFLIERKILIKESSYVSLSAISGWEILSYFVWQWVDISYWGLYHFSAGSQQWDEHETFRI